MKKFMTKAISYAMAGMMAGMMACSVAMPVNVAFAASSSDTNNNTATKNDLTNNDIIDTSKTGSLDIYKYDITSAEAAKVYTQGTNKATGEQDSSLQSTLKDFAIKGVEFTYLKVGEVEQYSKSSAGGTNGTEVKLVYEIPTDLATILGLSSGNAVNMSETGVAKPCSSGKLHFISDQVNDALASILAGDDVAAKNKLEGYVKNSGTVMPETDTNGHTSASSLPLGLYLVVETKVPEEVTCTTNPWFVQLPFTNVSEGKSSVGGIEWLYQAYCYPKNQTGNPTLDKSVRNAYSNSSSDKNNKNGSVRSGNTYVSSADSTALVVFNNDTNAGLSADTDAANYVANRGGYTKGDGTAAGGGASAQYSSDYAYNDTTTASEGDILDYILVSRLPKITSEATHLTEFTFVDSIDPNLGYNKDAKVALYSNEADAKANNTSKATVVWDAGTNFTAQYDATKMTIKFTDAGLKEINPKYSGYYLVVFYTVTVKSGATTVLGDNGMQNNVTLTWRRTSDKYYNTLEDRCYVYTYGIDLNKYFSDKKGDPTKVKFVLYNKTDAYYVVAQKASDGVYYVTGKATAENPNSDTTGATKFIPDSNGHLLINGLEGDEYQLSEVKTDDGYSLLKDQIVIGIKSAERDIIPSVAGTVGMTGSNISGIVADYPDANGNAAGIVDANGNPVTSTNPNPNTPAAESANGRTIGKTAMYVSNVTPSSATVDGIKATIASGRAKMSITNGPSFELPMTGGAGKNVLATSGILTLGLGLIYVMRRKKVR